MDTAAMSTRRAGRTKVIQASLRCREDTHSLVPPRHPRGNLSQKRNISHVTFRFVIEARTAPDPFSRSSNSQVEAGFPVLKSLGCDSMKITFA